MTTQTSRLSVPRHVFLICDITYVVTVLKVLCNTTREHDSCGTMNTMEIFMKCITLAEVSYCSVNAYSISDISLIVPATFK